MKIIIILIIGLIFLSGCSQVDLGKFNLSSLSKEDINKVIVCNEPYIRYASECCLDQNKNKICDSDENQKQDNLNKIQKENTNLGKEYSIFSNTYEKIKNKLGFNNNKYYSIKNGIYLINNNSFPKEIKGYKLKKVITHNDRGNAENIFVLNYFSKIKNKGFDVALINFNENQLNLELYKISYGKNIIKEYEKNNLSYNDFESTGIIEPKLNGNLVIFSQWFPKNNFQMIKVFEPIDKELYQWFIKEFPPKKEILKNLDLKELKNKIKILEQKVQHPQMNELQQKLGTGFSVFEVIATNTFETYDSISPSGKISDNKITKGKDTISISLQLVPGSLPSKLEDLTITLVTRFGANTYTYNRNIPNGSTKTFGVEYIKGPITNGYISKDDTIKFNLISNFDIGENEEFTIRLFPGTGNPLPINLITPPSMANELIVLK